MLDRLRSGGGAGCCEGVHVSGSFLIGYCMSVMVNPGTFKTGVIGDGKANHIL
jgi:hypothetical protein